MMTIGYVSHDGKFLLLPGISRGAILCNRGQKLFCGTKGLLKSIPSCSSMRISVACNASSNNYKRNRHFSRQQKGSSRGESKQYQEPEQSENTEETDFMSSKDGSMLSLTSNTKYQATATPEQRHEEVLELLRQVHVGLRERGAIKQEKIEPTQQGESVREIANSLIKKLREHTVDPKNSSPEEDFTADQAERSVTFEDEHILKLFGPNDIKSEESHEPGPLPSTRPASNFRRKSPIPRMKVQPVFSAEEVIKQEEDFTVDQKKSSPEEDFTVDQAERSNTFEDEHILNLFGPNDVKSEESHEPGPLPSGRPASNFRQKSPVPRMKFQPVFSTEKDINFAPLKTPWRRKKTGSNKPIMLDGEGRRLAAENDINSAPSKSELAAHAEPVVLDGPDELSVDSQLDPSGSDETAEETAESSATEISPDLGNLKLSELKDLAKSRGIKGYSRLKKGELVELLSARWCT